MRDISGQRFGRLVAISVHHSKNHRRFWACNCDCGNQAIVRQDQLITGKTKTCGCFQLEAKARCLERKKKPVKHKEHNKRWNPLKHEYPRIHRIWQGMKSRCYYPKNKCFHCYGGRGIRVCDEWSNSFNSFAEWALNNGYRDDLTIDRINVDGSYMPSNCRWVTMEDQQKNKRKRPSRKAQEAYAFPVCKTGDGREKRYTPTLSGRK